MAYHWEFAAEERLLVVRFSGSLDSETLVNSYWKTAALVTALEPTSAVMDLTAVNDFRVQSETVQGLAERESYFAEHVRRFIVAPHDLPYGLARMFQMMGENTRQQLRVVRSCREVYAQLSIRSIPKYERVSPPTS